MMTQNYFGIYDRFPPGSAWYDNVTTGGQLGYVKSSEPAAIFYKKMDASLRMDCKRPNSS